MKQFYWNEASALSVCPTVAVRGASDEPSAKLLSHGLRAWTEREPTSSSARGSHGSHQGQRAGAGGETLFRTRLAWNTTIIWREKKAEHSSLVFVQLSPLQWPPNLFSELLCGHWSPSRNPQTAAIFHIHWKKELFFCKLTAKQSLKGFSWKAPDCIVCNLLVLIHCNDLMWGTLAPKSLEMVNSSSQFRNHSCFFSLR